MIIATEDSQTSFDSFINDKLDIDETEDKIKIPTGLDLLDAILGGGIAIGTLSLISR